MRLTVTTATEVIVDRDVTYVQAEDPTGRFGVLPGHERFLTAIVPSVLVYRYGQGRAQSEAYVAVRRGMLRIQDDQVQVAVRAAHASDDLGKLEEEVRKAREKEDDRSYRSTRSLYQMQLAAWRRLMEYEGAQARR
jgi:F-type H+-transporting ATPase subunit epsilon